MSSHRSPENRREGRPFATNQGATTTEPTQEAGVPVALGPNESGGMSVWGWLLGVCVLLLASGGLKLWRDHRARTGTGPSEVKVSLANLPRVLGEWRSDDRSDGALAADIVRIAGCDQHIVRTYVNEQTGVRVTVAVLSGRAELLSQHTPEYCYPATGYRLVGEPSLRTIRYGSKSAVFWDGRYSRGRGGSEERQEVHFAFHHAGRWSPDLAELRNAFRASDDMLKVQIQRLVTDRETRGVDDPGEQFLQKLLAEIERRIEAGRVG